MNIATFVYCTVLIPASILIALIVVAFVGMVIRPFVKRDNGLEWLPKHIFLWSFALVYLAGIWLWVTS
jgi:cytochrome c oxidase assembly factor CtaG